MNDNTLIGYLVNGGCFVCTTCNNNPDPNDCKCFRVNIGIYSQTCSKCGKVIVDGAKHSDKSGPLHNHPLNLFSNGLKYQTGKAVINLHKGERHIFMGDYVLVERKDDKMFASPRNDYWGDDAIEVNADQVELR